MYVTFSAPTNACELATQQSGDSSVVIKGEYPCSQLDILGGIWRYDDSKMNQKKSDGRRYATGLRSVVAMTWNEDDNSLYALNHGRDYLNTRAPNYFSEWDNTVLPAEEFMKINRGDDFGWPYTYYDHFKGKRMLAPEYGGDGMKEASGYTEPLMGMPAHWAPNDMLFYKGGQFPSRYRKGAFVAFHGSVNRNPYPQAGYVVAFIPFKDGKPTKEWEIFADGFTGSDTLAVMQDARYRPMGLAEGPDGSLYISESKKGKVWRVIFQGDTATFDKSNLTKMEARKLKSYIKEPDQYTDRTGDKSQ